MTTMIKELTMKYCLTLFTALITLPMHGMQTNSVPPSDRKLTVQELRMLMIQKANTKKKEQPQTNVEQKKK